MHCEHEARAEVCDSCSITRFFFCRLFLFVLSPCLFRTFPVKNGSMSFTPLKDLRNFIHRLNANFGSNFVVLLFSVYFLVKGFTLTLLNLNQLPYFKNELKVDETQYQTFLLVSKNLYLVLLVRSPKVFLFMLTSWSQTWSPETQFHDPPKKSLICKPVTKICTLKLSLNLLQSFSTSFVCPNSPIQK